MACGDTLFMGKSFLSGFYYEDYTQETLKDKLNAFYDKHNYCGSDLVDNAPYDTKLFPMPKGFEGCDGAFDIVYEDGDGSGRE
jgi:hypothetical protein